jgi:hypothetical protein
MCYPTKCRQMKIGSTSNRVTYLTMSSWWFRLTRRPLPWPTHTQSFVSTEQHKDSPFPKAVPDDKHFYRSIALFRLTAGLLKKAVTLGINPKLNVDPRFIGFHPEYVNRYGYYAIFVTNPPFYMQQIWVPETAEFYELLKPEEKEQEDVAREARI